MKIVTVFGTRPEIIRLSLLIRKLDELGIKNVLVHTGQNYDAALSDVFFSELGLRKADHYLGVRAGTVGSQIARVMEKSEEVLLRERPDVLLVLGDTNSGLSAVAAARHNIPIAHMEAGNRCFDWSVPEEKNRKIIDHISDWLFPYTPNSRDNLLKENIHPSKICVSGNPIVEVLAAWSDRIQRSPVLETLGLKPGKYLLATSHREENVDNPARLAVIVEGFRRAAARFRMPLIWSVHPRTRKRIRAARIPSDPRMRLFPPFGLFDFVKLEQNAFCVLTDSGTVQEECSLFQVPVVTIRQTTERPETVECGSNVLSGVADPKRILECVEVMTSSGRSWESPYAKDRDVAARVAQFLVGHKS